jgi:hypothetical protein
MEWLGRQFGSHKLSGAGSTELGAPAAREGVMAGLDLDNPGHDGRR